MSFLTPDISFLTLTFAFTTLFFFFFSPKVQGVNAMIIIDDFIDEISQTDVFEGIHAEQMNTPVERKSLICFV